MKSPVQWWRSRISRRDLHADHESIIRTLHIEHERLREMMHFLLQKMMTYSQENETLRNANAYYAERTCLRVKVKRVRRGEFDVEIEAQPKQCREKSA